MGLTSIEWCDYTFNPWWGCRPVSRGCNNCYAETLSKRWGKDLWGAKAPRKMTSEANWREPVKWDRAAADLGRPLLVFAESMGDTFEDHPALVAARQRLWALTEATPNLIWLIPTKRPENILSMVPDNWRYDRWPANVWAGTSVEDDSVAVSRLNQLRLVPAPVRFVSAEPLVGPLDLTPWMSCGHESLTGFDGVPASVWQCDHCQAIIRDGEQRMVVKEPQLIDWVIVGGESGTGPRIAPVNPDWVRQIRDDCARHEIPFFFKQWGAWAPFQAGVSPGVQIRAYPGYMVQRVGKKKAGALLDGVEHRAFPAAARREAVTAC